MRYIFFLVIGLFLSFTGSSQSCLPQGIQFMTQSQIDSFSINHPNCAQIEGDVVITNTNITNLNGLHMLTSIGGVLYIEYTHSLINLTGLNNVTSIGGYLMLISNDALTSLTGLEGLKTIGGNLWIQANNALTSLTGLNNVTSVGGEFMVGNNDIITNLVGLEGLKSVSGKFGIYSNNALFNLTGIEGLNSIGGDLWVDLNPSLVSLTGLEGLDSINGYIGIKNNLALTSLGGLKNINAETMTELDIEYNPALSKCAVQSVCDFIRKTNVNLSTFIQNNANGCNSKAEVNEDCKHLAVENLSNDDVFSIYPNPSTEFITIETSATPAMIHLSIMNLSGQEILTRQIFQPKTQLDIRDLQCGVYFIRLTGERTVIVEKFIKR